jgi:hypothetical protein
MRLADPFDVTAVGLAAKLVIAGKLRFPIVVELKQPVRPAKHKMREITNEEKTRYTFILSPRPIEN